MKIVSIPAIWALCLTSVVAQAPKAAVAKPATVAPSSAEPAKPAGLITSDIEGRDLTFIAQAIDLGKAMTYLARQAGRTEKPELRGFGDDLVKSLAAQGAVLATLAEMRQVSVPPGDSVTQRSIAARLGKLGGVKLEKAILDTFIDLDRRLIAAYEENAKSPDPTISKFVEQTLPQAKEHLIYVQSMAGISSSRPAPAKPEGDKAKPSFRANVPLKD